MVAVAAAGGAISHRLREWLSERANRRIALLQKKKKDSDMRVYHYIIVIIEMIAVAEISPNSRSISNKLVGVFVACFPFMFILRHIAVV